MTALEGEPIGSRTELLHRLVFVDFSERTKLRFVGPQALWFLDQLVTNKVDDLSPGSGAEALLLTPNGRITSHIRITHRDGSGDAPDVLVDGPAGHAEPLLDFFGMRVFATKVAISDVSEEFSIIRVMGPRAEDVAAEAWGIELHQAQEHANVRFSTERVEGIGVKVKLPAAGWDLWVPAGSKNAILDRLAAAGGSMLSAGDLEALRVAAGLAAFGVDFGESYLPQEAAFERSVHFAKGCYLGQEAVAMAQRGRIKRRLRHLQFEGQGWTGKVIFDDKEAGKVTSAVSSNGIWFGIATIKTDVPVGQTVQVVAGEGAVVEAGGAAALAMVKELPGTHYGPRVPSARELREQLKGE